MAGSNMGPLAGQHFTTRELEIMGAALASALGNHWDLQQYGELACCNAMGCVCVCVCQCIGQPLGSTAVW